MIDSDELKKDNAFWTTCIDCQGRGKKSRKLRKKVKLAFQKSLEQFEKSNSGASPLVRPKRSLVKCETCKGTGLLPSTSPPKIDTENYPNLVIIGGGIGGVALGVACLHRGIPFTLYERDSNFDARSQGYGLTLQQASKAIEALGILSLKEGVISTKHIVHTTEGKVIGEWGMRQWCQSDTKKTPKRTNIHISRQSLRLSLLEQLGGHEAVHWGHHLIDYKECEGGGVDLTFEVDGAVKIARADLVVGADGIRSTMRRLLVGEDITPLRYLGCIVILGICPLSALGELESPLLDSATVFQTVNGNERIYMMPFDSNTIMWQLSFPLSEDEAKHLSAQGPLAIKEEACKRTQWHDPIPQIIEATQETLISGYPVYDRALLTTELMEKGKQITLIGDAAHPMSPFKGQGANQALLDALSLARGIAKGCQAYSKWRERGVRKSILTEFETEMLDRSATKVQDSADAAKFLHSDIVLYEGNEPRGKCLKK